MTAAAEQWVPLRVEQPGVPGEFVGILQVRQLPGTALADATLYIRPGLPADQLARLDQWAEERLQRLLEHGPDPDGWGRHDHQGTPVLQLHAREYRL